MVAINGTLARLLDPSRDVADRITAVDRLEGEDQPAAIEALTRVAQQIDVPPALAFAAGRMLGRLCFGRRQDIHDLDLAMVSDEAGDAYDQEIARLQRLNPNVRMKRGIVGSGR